MLPHVDLSNWKLGVLYCVTVIKTQLFLIFSLFSSLIKVLSPASQSFIWSQMNISGRPKRGETQYLNLYLIFDLH